MGVFFAIILILSIYGGTNYYIGRRLFQGLSFLFPHMNAKIYAGVYIFFALSLIIGYLPLPFGIRRIMSSIGAYWMGIYVYLLMFFLAADLIILLGSLVKIVPNPIPHSIRFYVLLIVLVLTTVVVSYGIYNANQIQHTSYEVQLKETNLSSNMKIVLISDLHLGAVNSEKRLENIVQDINNLEPDLVCIAGDIFNDNYNAIRNPEKAIELFKSIKSTYGVYANLGNHDGGNTFDDMVNFLEKSNIDLLTEEYVIIDERLVLLGRLDPSPIGGFGELNRKEDINDILDSIDRNLPIVVMEHTPPNVEQYGRKVDLILSGHTHRGQIFPFNLITPALFTTDYGHFQKNADSPHYIVSSGVGIWGPPMRVATKNEIVEIQVQFSNSDVAEKKSVKD